MPDISFESFTPRSFEQFAQALAASVLGPGILVFGDGPDGGREAAHEGSVSYPDAVERWPGPLVMQAKFRQRSAGGGSDTVWLVEQLRREAKLYAAGSRAVPTSYLLVTNVRLSGVEAPGRTGGQAKVRKAFEDLLAPLGVVHFDVWHEEKIAVLLDAHPGLFRSYDAWLGGREALSAVFREFEARIPDFRSVMLLYLQRELRAQRGTRLQQAGHVGDGATHLESVFVDLPYGVDPADLDAHARLLEGVGANGAEQGILRTLLGGASLKADPATLEATRSSSVGQTPNRWLVLGGPGQGKSTVTQFLGQVLRYRLLRDEPRTSLSSDVRDALDAIGARLSELALLADGVRRYPVRVDLPLFADALTVASGAGRRLSLLEYVARSMAASADCPALDQGLLRRWLGRYPFLLMLDGLDEVPPSGARRDVIDAIVEFWDEVAVQGADVVMTVTTRPQGYNDDLDPGLYARLEMTRLSPERALVYAERVAVLKFEDTDRRALVLSRLAAAAKAPATALLMVSPLQVAILFQLVDQRGTAPADRWTLFDEYLSVVMKREQEKHGAAFGIVRAHETMIRRLLRRVGLLLHVEAEAGGAADAFLARKRLEALAGDLLEEEGFEGEELQTLAAGVVTAATDRLVFLEQRVEGRIEFDVRSLQEFMAAAELMTGGDGHVRARLREIAGRAHWQHVYRIAASKAFSAPDAVGLRDTILLINRELDGDGPAGRVLGRGAVRSLELLDDGLAAGLPRYRRLLAEHALELLGRGEAAVDGRLVALVRTLGEGFARDALQARLTSGGTAERRAAWSLLVACVHERDDWADRLVDRLWPADGRAGLDALGWGVAPPVGSRADDRFAATLATAAPVALHDRFRSETVSEDPAGQLARRHPYLVPLLGRVANAIEVDFLSGGSVELTLGLVPMAGEALERLYAAPGGGGWAPYAQVESFVRDPSPSTAAAFVEALSDPAAAELAGMVQLPWPLLNLYTLATHGNGPEETAAAVLAGAYGRPEDWNDAESRLSEVGVTLADLDRWRRGVLLDTAIGRTGAPLPNRMALSRGTNTGAYWLSDLKEAAIASPPGLARNFMARMVSFAAPGAVPPLRLSAGEYLSLVRASDPDRLLEPGLLASVSEEEALDPELVAFVAEAGEAGRFQVGDRRSRPGDEVRRLLTGSDREGVLAMALASAAASGGAVVALAAEIPRERLLTDGISEAARDAIAALRIVAGVGEVDLADLVPASGDSVGQHALLAVAGERRGGSPRLAEALAYIAGAVVEAERVRQHALRLLRAEIDRERSNLARPNCWREMDLPTSVLARMGAAAQ